jgi:branched-chain amino acid transport system substrate-binding protein
VRRGRTFVLAVIMVLLAGCSSVPKQGSSIVIGEIDPVTGPVAAKGYHNGIVLAVEQANRHGGIDGRRIRLVFRDNQSRPDIAAAAAQDLLAREGVTAFVGGFVDSLVAPVASVANAGHVPYVAAASLQKELTAVGNRYFFRVSSLDAFIASTTGFVVARGAKRVGILHATTPGSAQLAQDQRAALTAKGVVVDPFESLTIGTQDFTPLLARIREAAPDALLVNDPSDGDLILMAKQMKALGHQPPIVLFSFGIEPPTVAALGSAADGLYGTVAWEPSLPVGGKAGTAFGDDYRRRFHEEADEGAAHGFAAATALLRALRTLPSGRITGPALANALHAVSVDTPLGTVRFLPTGDPAAYRRYVVRVEGGTYMLVYRAAATS